jgi:hypothetical protein
MELDGLNDTLTDSPHFDLFRVWRGAGLSPAFLIGCKIMPYVSSRSLCASVIASAAFFALASAQATTIVTTGDISVTLGNPQPAEPHIFFDAATNTQTGVGHVGSQTGDAGTSVVNFTNTGVNVDFANGYSTISPSAQGGLFNSLTVSVPTGWFFTDLEFSTLKGNQVTVTGFDGATQVGSYSNDSIGTGLEAWLVLAINSKDFTSLVITSSDGFTQMKEFAISGLQQVCTVNCTTGGGGAGETPIPAALPLLGSVLGGGFVFSRLRRKRRVA